MGLDMRRGMIRQGVVVMKSESIKNVYKGLRYFLLICLISTVILSFFDLYGNIPRIFLGVFALIGFVNTYE